MSTVAYHRRNRSRGLCRCGRAPAPGRAYCQSCIASRIRSDQRKQLARQQRSAYQIHERRNWGVDLTGVPQLPSAIANKLKSGKPLTDLEEAVAHDVYLAAGHVIQMRIERKRWTGELMEEQEDAA